MYIAGHIGFTLGAFGLLRRKKASFSLKEVIIFSAVALVPDALDRAVHFVASTYPLHGLFHSLPFYAVMICIFSLTYKKAVVYPAMMAFSAALDFLNVNPGSLLYPLSWASTAHVPLVRGKIEAFMGHFPHTLGYRLSVGHYLVFELIGLLIIVLTVRKAVAKSRDNAISARAIEDGRLRTLFVDILSPLGRSSSPLPEAQDLPALKELALRNGLLPLLYVQLLNGSANETGHVRKFLQDVKPYFMRSAVISLKQEALEKEVQSLFRKEDLPVIVIKGNALARDIYNDRNCRLSEDVDILVKRSDVFRAAGILADAGYSGEPDVPLEYRYLSIHHAIFYKAQGSTPLELHWLFGVPSYFELTSEEIWDEVVCDDRGDYRLPPELQIVLLLVHHHSHSFRELKTLIDIVWTLWRYEAAIDWHLFVSRLEKAGLIKTAQITLSQISSLWNDTSAGVPAARTLAGEIEKSGHAMPGRLASYFSMDITGKRCDRPSLDKIIKRFALDRPSAIMRSFVVMLPSWRALGARYGDRRLWKLPVNYSRYLMWQLKCWKG